MRFYPLTDQLRDPEREKPDNCLLDAVDLVLRCPQLNDKSGRDDEGAKREVTEVGYEVSDRVLVCEPQPDREGGDPDERDAK
jgi:hypothetical protein